MARVLSLLSFLIFTNFSNAAFYSIQDLEKMFYEETVKFMIATQDLLFVADYKDIDLKKIELEGLKAKFVEKLLMIESEIQISTDSENLIGVVGKMVALHDLIKEKKDWLSKLEIQVGEPAPKEGLFLKFYYELEGLAFVGLMAVSALGDLAYNIHASYLSIRQYVNKLKGSLGIISPDWTKISDEQWQDMLRPVSPEDLCYFLFE